MLSYQRVYYNAAGRPCWKDGIPWISQQIPTVSSTCFNMETPKLDLDNVFTHWIRPFWGVYLTKLDGACHFLRKEVEWCQLQPMPETAVVLFQGSRKRQLQRDARWWCDWHFCPTLNRSRIPATIVQTIEVLGDFNIIGLIYQFIIVLACFQAVWRFNSPRFLWSPFCSSWWTA